MMSSNWINNSFASLPGTDDVLFSKLWSERRLLFDGRRPMGDIVDECSARLVAAALTRRQNLLVVLPDPLPHRRAFLFATGLIRDFLDSRTTGARRASQVLYFGSAVGIRDQLRRTTISGLRMSLSDVFDQRDVRRRSNDVSGSAATSFDSGWLPKVTTIFGPSDPVAIIRNYHPSWIALDGSDATSLGWVRLLLDEARLSRIPVIGWTTNPLSEWVDDFAGIGHTFVWPRQTRHHVTDVREFTSEPDVILSTQLSSIVSPLVLGGKSVDGFSPLVQKATTHLVNAIQNLDGRLTRDSIAVHWKHLRSLESLAVPIDFYEVEAPRFWGLKSFAQLRLTCEYFCRACETANPRLCSELEHASSLLQDAQVHLQNQACPLWSGLETLCVEDVHQDEARILTFSGDSRKQLFLFALLARHNITETDLQEMHIYVASLNDLRRWAHWRYFSSEGTDDTGMMIPIASLKWRPVLVGLPSPTLIPRLLPVFDEEKVSILLYPHQISSLERRCTELSDRLSANGDHIAEVLSRLTGVPHPKVNFKTHQRLSLDKAIELNVESPQKQKPFEVDRVWQPDDAVSEVERLFAVDEDSTSDEMIFSDQAENDATNTSESPEEIWCEEIVKVQCDQGWHIYFAPNDIINAVQGHTLDARYVRSLRVGEQVLFIHGQHRQNLYDLIISRVHKHPSIELHLAMIRRWQEDLQVAFAHWQRHMPNSADVREQGGRDLNGLLRRMHARGSQLMSTLTFSFWLKGLVLCPLDPEDLRRVAEVLDMSFVRQHYRRIAQAANRLRGLHRGLSHKLNRWLEDHATGSIHKSDDDVLDAELGLTFGDVRNSLLLLRIERIENVKGSFLRSSLGKAERDK